MKKVKQYEVSDKGYVELTLTGKKEFDAYMFTLINRDAQALPCQRKQRSSVTLLYDISEQISLPTLLRLVEFDEREAHAFLCQMFDAIGQCSAKLPIFAPVDGVFYEVESASFSFIVLPIHEHVYENDWGQFVRDLAMQMRLPKQSLYGCLCDLEHLPSLSPQLIADRLRQWQREHSFWERWRCAWHGWRKRRERRAENDQRLSEERRRMRFVQRAKQQDEKEEAALPVSSDTVVLFPQAANGRLKDKAGHCYPLRSQTTIGRNEQCDIVLPQPTVSLRHACIRKEANGRFIQDLASRNGTRLNGKPLPPNEAVRLHDQDVISLADYELIYEEQAG